jgi:hypothetical protein
VWIFPQHIFKTFSLFAELKSDTLTSARLWAQERHKGVLSDTEHFSEGEKYG